MNNKIAYLRKRHENNRKKDITTSGELKDALDKLIAIPDDNHEAFVNDYKIATLSCENKARFWFNITTKNLLKRYKENPQKLIQIDGTYKLIWNPDTCKEGFPVQVHGTSNLLFQLVCALLQMKITKPTKRYLKVLV